MAVMKKAAPADPVAALEAEQSKLRQQANQEQSHMADIQTELASLLASQHGASLGRVPLAKAVMAAQATLKEAQEALARNIGKAGEDAHTAKAYEAEQAHKQAQEVVTAFDVQYDFAATYQKINTLRAAIAQGEESLRKANDTLHALTTQIAQEIEGAQRAALKRIYEALADLLVIYESDGLALGRLRRYDTVVFERMVDELVIDRQQIYDMILPNSYASAGWNVGAESGPRPYLRERMQQIKERLRKLSG